MDEIVYTALIRYFNTLSKLGYMSYTEVYKMLYLIAIRELIYTDFRGFITEDNYREIEQSLECLFGSSCLIPYPEYCNNSIDRLKLKD